jgi:lipopolysaccharide export LptBFGC system permease protein LptF
VPFLVWCLAYAPLVGRAEVPRAGDLSSPAAERLAYALLVPGMAFLALAVALGSPAAIRMAALIVLGGTLGVAAALARMLGHLRAARRATPGIAGTAVGSSLS